MSETYYDHAPGDSPADAEHDAPSTVRTNVLGLILAIVLTATSFWAANTSLLWPPGVALGLAVLAVAQMGIHLVFFLHMTSSPDNTNHALALAFGVLVVFMVVAGSLWIMRDLNEGMKMPAGQSMGSSMEMPMNMPMQH